jgi:hypothetical protein
MVINYKKCHISKVVLMLIVLARGTHKKLVTLKLMKKKKNGNLHTIFSRLPLSAGTLNYSFCAVYTPQTQTHTGSG